MLWFLAMCEWMHVYNISLESPKHEHMMDAHVPTPATHLHVFNAMS